MLNFITRVIACVCLGSSLLIGSCAPVYASEVPLNAAGVPPNAKVLIPKLSNTLDRLWPEVVLKSVFAAQIEKETCISLKHSKCWSTRAELKTSREYGFGLGQITSTSKFDNFKYVKTLSPELKDWKFENRYSADLQLQALVLMNKRLFNTFKGVPVDQRAFFMLASYNGGVGGVSSDIKVCSNTKGCDVNKWFGNVENTSRKNKVAKKGYGESFFHINRRYVREISSNRRCKYVFMDAIKK